MRILGIVHSCNTCPNKQYSSGGRYECNKTRVLIDPTTLAQGDITEWCPLAPHPAPAMEKIRAELQRLRALREEAPCTPQPLS